MCECHHDQLRQLPCVLSFVWPRFSCRHPACSAISCRKLLPVCCRSMSATFTSPLDRHMLHLLQPCSPRMFSPGSVSRRTDTVYKARAACVGSILQPVPLQWQREHGECGDDEGAVHQTGDRHAVLVGHQDAVRGAHSDVALAECSPCNRPQPSYTCCVAVSPGSEPSQSQCASHHQLIDIHDRHAVSDAR